MRSNIEDLENIYNAHLLRFMQNPIGYRNYQHEKFLKSFADRQIDTITSAIIEITRICNFECAFCPRNDLNVDEKKTHMSFVEFKKIVNKLPKTVRQISLNGLGESFLNPEFVLMLKYAKQIGLKNHLNNNGSQFSEESLGYIDDLCFSLDTVMPNEVDNLRRNMKLNVFLKNIKAAIDFRNKMKFPLRIGINTVLSSENINELEMIFETAHECGVDYLRLSPPHNGYRFGTDSYKQMNNFLLKQNINWHKPIEIYQNTKYQFELNIYYPKYLKSYCGFGFETVYIDINGNVRACCIKMLDDELVFGNLNIDTFESIEKSAKYKAFRDAHIHKFAHRICDICASGAGNA